MTNGSAMAWSPTIPLPVTNFRQVFAMSGDVLLVLNEFILKLLLEIGPF